jgi:kynurenine formamidase
MPSQFLDLSHEIEHGMVTYKGLPAPIICDYLSREASKAHYAEGTTFQIGKIELVANTGTYIDSPFHRHADGADLAGLSLDSLANLPGLCFTAPANERAIGPEVFGTRALRGKAVLVRTDWARRWRTDAYFSGHPFLTRAAATHLRAAGAALVGIDSFNIDSTDDRERPAHTLLLGAGIPIVEHLCHLEQLPAAGFTFTAVPPKIIGFGTFPVRAFANLSP